MFWVLPLCGNKLDNKHNYCNMYIDTSIYIYICLCISIHIYAIYIILIMYSP